MNFWIRWRLETHSGWTIDKLWWVVFVNILIVLAHIPLIFFDLWWAYLIMVSYPIYLIIHFSMTIVAFFKTNNIRLDEIRKE